MVAQRGTWAWVAWAAFGCGTVCGSEWLLTTYQDVGEIRNYFTADRLIDGFRLEGGAPVVASYSTSNLQDNGDVGGFFGLGEQIVGIGPGDVDDFAFVGTGDGAVNLSASFILYTNTDDGSRVRASLNGGPMTEIITDDVLSGPHEVASAPIALNSGDTFAFEWMWFERAGGAEGELYYSADGGVTRYLMTDPSGGLSLTGGEYTGAVYKSNRADEIFLGTDGLIRAKAMVAANTAVVGVPEIRGTFNITGSGGTGFFGGDDRPPGVPSGDLNDYAVLGTGYLRVVTEGDYKFGQLSDDGGEFVLRSPDGTTVVAQIFDDTYHGNGFPGDVKLSDTVHLTPGYYPIEAIFFEAGGGDSYELFLVDPNYTGLQSEIPAESIIALMGDTANGGLEVTQQVPEPSGLMLLVLGATVLRRRGRRR